MDVVYRRPSAGTRRLRQELLHDADDLKISLLRRSAGAGPREVVDAVTLEPGAWLLWYTFPGRRWEVAAFHAPDRRLLGHYTNVVEPPEIGQGEWRITDLFLDVWQPADRPREPRVLDRDELSAALERGAIDAEDARRARQVAARVAARARAGEWPPSRVRRWPLETISELRLLRDEPGVYHANKVSGRIVALGIYVLGAVSLTSLVFAATTDALVVAGDARRVWLGTLAVEAALLTPAALAGKLPATRRVRLPEAMDENTLFLGAAVTGAAVLLVNESSLWRSLLSAVYGALGLFLAVFAVSRGYFDRELPLAALAGLAVCAVALVVLL